MLVTVQARKRSKVAGDRMARGAVCAPLLAVFSRVDREELRIVILECHVEPVGFNVAN